MWLSTKRQAQKVIKNSFSVDYLTTTATKNNDYENNTAHSPQLDAHPGELREHILNAVALIQCDAAPDHALEGRLHVALEHLVGGNHHVVLRHLLQLLAQVLALLGLVAE